MIGQRVLVADGPSSTIGSCIMSALSIPPSQKANIARGSQSAHNPSNVPCPEQYSVVTVYTEVEVQDTPAEARTDFWTDQVDVTSADEAAGETLGVAKALETLTKTFALRKESLENDSASNRQFAIQDVSGEANDDVQTDTEAKGSFAEDDATIQAAQLPVCEHSSIPLMDASSAGWCDFKRSL